MGLSPEFLAGPPTDDSIARAAASDPDAPLASDDQLAVLHRGQSSGRKLLISLRVDEHIVDAYRSTGKGWQTRMQVALAAGLPTDAFRPTDVIRALEHSAERTLRLAHQVHIALRNDE